MSVQDRLGYLRNEIRAERISWGEIAELQGLAEHIGEGDVELLEWAGVPEWGVAEVPDVTPYRVPRTIDGSTWRAEATAADGQLIGAEARTKARVLELFSEQWERFA